MVYVLYCIFLTSIQYIVNIFCIITAISYFFVCIFSSAVVHHLVNILTHKSLQVCGFSPRANGKKVTYVGRRLSRALIQGIRLLTGRRRSFLFKKSYKKMFFGSFFQTLGTVLK